MGSTISSKAVKKVNGISTGKVAVLGDKAEVNNTAKQILAELFSNSKENLPKNKTSGTAEQHTKKVATVAAKPETDKSAKRKAEQAISKGPSGGPTEAEKRAKNNVKVDEAWTDEARLRAEVE